MLPFYWIRSDVFFIDSNIHNEFWKVITCDVNDGNLYINKSWILARITEARAANMNVWFPAKITQKWVSNDKSWHEIIIIIDCKVKKLWKCIKSRKNYKFWKLRWQKVRIVTVANVATVATLEFYSKVCRWFSVLLEIIFVEWTMFLFWW